MKYPYILFDWDGSITHSLQAWLDTFKHVFSHYNITIEDKEIIQNIFHSPERCIEYGVPNYPIFHEEFELHAHATIPHSPLHNKVEETIKTLFHKGSRNAIVTSSRRNTLEKALTLHSLTDYFHTIVTADDVGNRKPDPEPLNKAITFLKANPEQTIIVGDNAVDIIAGKAAHITTVVHFPPENELFYSYEEIKSLKPDYIIRDFSELITIVEP